MSTDKKNASELVTLCVKERAYLKNALIYIVHQRYFDHAKYVYSEIEETYHGYNEYDYPKIAREVRRMGVLKPLPLKYMMDTVEHLSKLLGGLELSDYMTYGEMEKEMMRSFKDAYDMQLRSYDLECVECEATIEDDKLVNGKATCTCGAVFDLSEK